MHATESGRMHGIHNDMQSYIHQMEWRLTFEAWEVIVNSNSMHEELQRSFKMPSDKIVIIPNGTDPDVFDFEFNNHAMRSKYAEIKNKSFCMLVVWCARKVFKSYLMPLLVCFLNGQARSS